MITPNFESENIPLDPTPRPEISREAPLAKSRIQGDLWEESATSESFHRGPVQRRKGYVLIAFSWLAATVDSLFLLGMSLLFTVAFAFITKNTLQLETPQSLVLASAAMLLIFLACFYMIVLRSFLGFTIGEWACSLRLGSPRERQSKFYSLKVIARVALVGLTGFITLPLLALIFGKDLAGNLSGVRLISLK